MQGDLSESLLGNELPELQVEEQESIYTPSRTARFGAYLRSRSRKTWIITGVSVALVALVATVVVIGVAVGTAVGVTESEEAQQRRAFNDWMTQWNMTYAEEEYEMRLANFKKTLQLIQQHSSPNYQVGLNKFAAMTAEELNSYRGLQPPANTNQKRNNPYTPVPAVTTRSTSYPNWVKAGKVAGIQNQGNCGDCWAFASTGAITSYISITTGANPNATQFSEQYLVDCTGSAGNSGCNGGWPGNSFTYAETHGIPIEHEYTAYHQSQGTCSLSNACGLHGSVKVTNWGYVPANNESALLVQLRKAPVAIAIDASSAFMSYTSGIFDGPCSNSPSSVNHAILLVGAGVTSTGHPYWLAKNQWGLWWGEKGYVRIAMNANNMCCVACYGQWVHAAACT